MYLILLIFSNMKRKLIKQGENALTVTIPKEWTRTQNLSAGDEIDIEVQDNCVVLRAQQKAQEKKTRIHFPAAHSSVYRFLLANAYRKGFDEVEITFDEPRQLAEIQGFLEELLGVEITQQVKNSIIVRCVALPAEQEYAVLFRRLLHIIQTAFMYFIEDAQQQEFDVAKMNSLQKNLLRISNFCTRVLHNSPAQDRSQAYAEYVTLKIHDYVMSQLRRLYARTRESKKSSKLLREYMRDLQSFFSDISISMFKHDLKAMIALVERKQVLFEQKDECIRKAQGIERELIQDASILFRLMTLYLGPLSIMTFSETKDV